MLCYERACAFVEKSRGLKEKEKARVRWIHADGQLIIENGLEILQS